MKYLLIGLVALGSISAYANDLNCSFKQYLNNQLIDSKSIEEEKIEGGELRTSFTTKNKRYEIHVLAQDLPANAIWITVKDLKNKTESTSSTNHMYLNVNTLDSFEVKEREVLQGSCQIGSF
jgi:hypothetical protein